MLLVEIDEAQGIATLTPDGSLSKDDFESATKIIDPYIEEAGKLNGIIIYTQSFPGWDSFAGLCSHLKFVQDHHKHISCVALVTDSKVGKFAEPIASHFISSTIKLFPYLELSEAKEWISNCSDSKREPAMKIIPNGANRIDIELNGKISADDMRTGIDDLISKSQNFEHAKMLYTVVALNIPSFGAMGIELSRLPELIRLFKKFDRCAVLANQNWIKNISELEGHLFPGLEIKAFNLDEREVAEAWLAA